jgi:hypothetical protein
VGFCDGQKWRWDRFSPRTSVSLASLHSICFSTIIFTITRGWHNRPGVAAVPVASQTKLKQSVYTVVFWDINFSKESSASIFRAELIVAVCVMASWLVGGVLPFWCNIPCPSGFVVKRPRCRRLQASVCSGASAVTLLRPSERLSMGSLCSRELSLPYLLEGMPWEQDLQQLLIPELCPSSRLIWCSLPHAPAECSTHRGSSISPPRLARSFLETRAIHSSRFCRNYNET